MRYRINNYEIEGLYIFIPGHDSLGELNINDIRLIVDETDKIVICSSMQKDNVSVRQRISPSILGRVGIYVPTSVATLNSEHSYTIELDFGDNLDDINENISYLIETKALQGDNEEATNTAIYDSIQLGIIDFDEDIAELLKQIIGEDGDEDSDSSE